MKICTFQPKIFMEKLSIIAKLIGKKKSMFIPFSRDTENLNNKEMNEINTM